MRYKQTEIEQLTYHCRAELSNELDETLKWRWDDRFSAMLSEFAQNRSDGVLASLRERFPHEWDKTSIRFMPSALKMQLGDLSRLTKEQKLFTLPAHEQTPAIVAIWWPWGHGGTYSLRVKLLDETYQYVEAANEPSSIFDKLRQFFG
ncbi:hypothetical protein [Thalassotalea fusca]